MVAETLSCSGSGQSTSNLADNGRFPGTTGAGNDDQSSRFVRGLTESSIYSRFWTSSRIRSIAHLISTTCAEISASAALLPIVLVSRNIS